MVCIEHLLPRLKQTPATKQRRDGKLHSIVALVEAHFVSGYFPLVVMPVLTIRGNTLEAVSFSLHSRLIGIGHHASGDIALEIEVSGRFESFFSGKCRPAIRRYLPWNFIR